MGRCLNYKADNDHSCRSNAVNGMGLCRDCTYLYAFVLERKDTQLRNRIEGLEVEIITTIARAEKYRAQRNVLDRENKKLRAELREKDDQL